MSKYERLVRMSTRGRVTLPAAARRALGVEAGGVLLVRVDDGRIVLEPVSPVAIELYDDTRIAEFERAASLSEGELAGARAAWRR
mgnify:CR=1 FL=1